MHVRPEHSLFRFHTSLFAGCIVLKVSQGLSIDLLSLLQVKKLGHKNDMSVYVARCLARHQVRLLSPMTWHGWGRLFIDAYFAAVRNATAADARVMMSRWKQVHQELIVFYDETQEPQQPVPVPIADIFVEPSLSFNKNLKSSSEIILNPRYVFHSQSLLYYRC